MALGLRREGFHQPCDANSANDRHQDDPGAPDIRWRVEISVIMQAELPEKQDVVEKCDQQAEDPGANPADHADKYSEKA